MATIQPNFNPTPFNGPFASPTSASVQFGGQVSGANFGSIQSSSQQMLQSLALLQAGWVAIGSGQLIGDGTLPSLGMPLSGEYAGMTFGSPGNAANLDSLQSPLRYMYGGMMPGMSDDYNVLGAPLRGAYGAMMTIPGMPPAPPLF